MTHILLPTFKGSAWWSVKETDKGVWKGALALFSETSVHLRVEICAFFTHLTQLANLVVHDAHLLSERVLLLHHGCHNLRIYVVPPQTQRGLALPNIHLFKHNAQVPLCVALLLRKTANCIEHGPYPQFPHFQPHLVCTWLLLLVFAQRKYSLQIQVECFPQKLLFCLIYDEFSSSFGPVLMVFGLSPPVNALFKEAQTTDFGCSVEWRASATVDHLAVLGYFFR